MNSSVNILVFVPAHIFLFSSYVKVELLGHWNLLGDTTFSKQLCFCSHPLCVRDSITLHPYWYFVFVRYLYFRLRNGAVMAHYILHFSDYKWYWTPFRHWSFGCLLWVPFESVACFSYLFVAILCIFWIQGFYWLCMLWRYSPALVICLFSLLMVTFFFFWKINTKLFPYSLLFR